MRPFPRIHDLFIARTVLGTVLLTWAVLRPFVSGDLLGIPVLLAACPTAMLVTALCLQYDRSDAFASKCIFINTILSAATIPLVIWLLF